MINELTRQDWLFRDNGFGSLAYMQRVHAVLCDAVNLALPKQLRRTVVDLGCGNGALLQSICRGDSRVVPFGVELNHQSVLNARFVLPGFADQVICGNIFSERTLACLPARLDLALLMPGRLLEERADAVVILRDFLASRVRLVIAYAYGDWLEATGGLEHLARSIGYELAPLVELNKEVAAGLLRL